MEENVVTVFGSAGQLLHPADDLLLYPALLDVLGREGNVLALRDRDGCVEWFRVPLRLPAMSRLQFCHRVNDLRWPLDAAVREWLFLCDDMRGLDPSRLLHGLTAVSQSRPELVRPFTEAGMEVCSQGRSCFPQRNRWLVRTCNRPQEAAVFIVDAAGLWTASMPLYLDHSDVDAMLCQAEADSRAETQARDLARLVTASRDGRCAAVAYTEGVDCPEVPCWRQVWRFRTACTADHRQGAGHTYLGVFLREGVSGTVALDLPQEYRGAFIGRLGNNVKALESRFGVRFRLDGQSRGLAAVRSAPAR